MRRWLVLLLAVFCFNLSASSQTAEELVNKNIEAKGGMDKIKAIKTLRMTGKLIGAAASPRPRARTICAPTWCARPFRCRA